MTHVDVRPGVSVTVSVSAFVCDMCMCMSVSDICKCMFYANH